MDWQKKIKLDDRLSSLPDELIHHILSFLEVRSVVQTSILSKRWKLIWTTLPFLNFLKTSTAKTKFIHNFLLHRNHVTNILHMRLSNDFCLSLSLVNKFIKFAVAHNVQDLDVDFQDYSRDDDADAIKLSIFSSTSIKKLNLRIQLGLLSESDCWDLPALTTLHLCLPWTTRKLPQSHLLCLPALQTLSLQNFELPKSANLPALTTLILYNVVFPENTSEFFRSLVNLQNLTWFLGEKVMKDCFINCLQLVNLEINDYSSHSVKIMVLAPKLRNFSCIGVFQITFGVSELENVSINLSDSSIYDTEILYSWATDMFAGFGSVKILTLDLETIEALSFVSDILVCSPCPCYSLQYVKVPEGYKSRMSASLKGYLLGRSPKATIVTQLPQENVLTSYTNVPQDYYIQQQSSLLM